MLKILLATGSDKLDKFIRDNATGIQFDTVASRRYIIPRNKEHQYEIIILSGVLPGREDIREIIFETQRESNCRIIYFAGATKPTDIIDIFMLGVRDIIFEPIDPKTVIRSMAEPATYGIIASKLKTLPAQSASNIKRITDLIKRNTPDPPPDVTPEAREILAGILKLLRQEPGDTIEESLLNIEEGLNNLITQKI